MRRQPWAITMLRSKDQMIEEEAASIEVRSLNSGSNVKRSTRAE